MKMIMITMAAIVGVGLMALCGVMSSKNGAINLEETVKTAASDIDGKLTNRFNKFKELAQCVKKYDEHEYKTLVEVITARGKNMSGDEAKQCIASFSRVEERYPDLKSQANYKHLMNDISITENSLEQVRKAYNASVREYSFYCRKFPTSIFLGMTGYEVQKFKYYEASPEVKDTTPIQLF